MDINLPEPFDILMGKVETKALTNFFGAPGTGKTNICLLAMKECVDKGGEVVFIDTEGGFSLERVKQVCSNHEEVLKSVELVEPKNFDEQGKAIRALKDKKVDLIILDSAVALYRLEHSEDEEGKGKRNRKIMEANRELSRQMSILSNIAREKGIPVIVTCHMFKSWDNGTDEIVGGDSVKYWSKAIVFLEKTGRFSERKASVVKHRSLPEGKNVKFVIVDEGVKPSGFKIF